MEVFLTIFLVLVLCQSIDKSIKEENILENREIPLKFSKKRKLAEILIDKKNRLAVGVYDLLDKHIRLIDDELNAIDEAIDDCNGKHDTRGKSDVKSNSVTFETDENTKSKSVSFVNEPVYCNCRRVAFGEMIACDNEECLIEWFHFPCVNLTKLPRKLWYCPDCSLNTKK
jgi:inhibitor of growth protein 4